MGLLATVTFEVLPSRQAKDRVSNSFAIKTQGDAHTEANFAALTSAILNFYNAVPTGGVKAIKDYLSAAVGRVQGDMAVRIYDITGRLAGEPHGSPVYSALTQLVAPAINDFSLPNEVALCATLEAVGREDQPVETPDGPDSGIQPDRPRQRHTGRIYVGPLSHQADTKNSTDSRPTTQFMTDVRLAFARLVTEVGAIPASPAVWDLAVWSRADATLRAVNAVSTDNAWDTQRRRGTQPGARTRLLV